MFRRLLAGIAAVLFASIATAAPVTLNVTPTFAPAAGIVDGYRAYRSCDATPVLVGPVTSGQPFSFQHEVTSGNPHVVVRAFNSAGEGGGNCVELGLTLSPPGDTTTTYQCDLSPVSGGTCVALP